MGMTVNRELVKRLTERAAAERAAAERAAAERIQLSPKEKAIQEGLDRQEEEEESR